MRWIALVVLSGMLFAFGNCHAQDSLVPPPPTSSESTKLDLDACVAMAMMSHPRLFEANARVSEAQGSAVQAGLYPNPRIDSGNPQVIGPNRTGVYSIGVTQEIVRGKKLQLDQAARRKRLIRRLGIRYASVSKS